MLKFFFTKSSFLAACMLATPVWAQQRQMTPDEMQQFEYMMGMGGQEVERLALMLQLGVNVFFLLLFGIILLIARRNMKGWNQPLKEVWFAFSGRLNRKAYWLKGILLVSIIGMSVQLFALLMGALLGGEIGAVIGGIGVLIVILPLVVFNVWVALAVAIKRAHDLGHSGWWLFAFLIPFYNLWMMIEMLFFRGVVGPNAYGPDPIDPYNDMIDELYGDAGDDHGDLGDAPLHPAPRPPQDGPDAPQGFGTRKFVKPPPPIQDTHQPDNVFTPTDIPGGSANLDVIKRRLGDDIMRPIKRKGGGGRDSEG